MSAKTEIRKYLAAGHNTFTTAEVSAATGIPARTLSSAAFHMCRSGELVIENRTWRTVTYRAATDFDRENKKHHLRRMPPELAGLPDSQNFRECTGMKQVTMESVNKIIQEITATKGHREYCNSLHLTLSGDGYVRSIVDWTCVTKPERIDVLIAHVEKQDSEVQSLRKQLVAVTEQRDALVVENAVIDSERLAWAELYGDEMGDPYVIEKAKTLQTPSTVAAIAALRAEGVEMFAKALRVPGDDPFMDAIAVGVAGTADNFARQLRESKREVQS